MNGVDVADQLMKSYAIDRRGYRWWLRIFTYYLNAALANAYSLYTTQTKNQMSHLKFQSEIATNLMNPEKKIRHKLHFPIHHNDQLRCFNTRKTVLMQPY